MPPHLKKSINQAHLENGTYKQIVTHLNSDTNDSDPNNHKIDGKSKILYPPCETYGKTNYSTERCYVGANAANRQLPWKNRPQE